MRTNKLRFSSLVSVATLPSFIQFNAVNTTTTTTGTATKTEDLSSVSVSSSSPPPPSIMRRQKQKRHSTRLDAVVGCANTFINRNFSNNCCQKRLTNKTSKHDAMRHRSVRVYSDTLMLYSSSMMIENEDEEFNLNLSQYLIQNDHDDHEALAKISMTLKANYDIEQNEDYLSTNGIYLYDDECHDLTASSVSTIDTLDSFLSKLREEQEQQQQHKHKEEIISNSCSMLVNNNFNDCEAVHVRNTNNDQKVQDNNRISRMMMRSRKAISTNNLIHNFKLKCNRNENEVYIYI
jgi:hypothetical protein